MREPGKAFTVSGPSVLAAAALFSLNVWIAWRLFLLELTDHFNSVEGFFIGLSRYISVHWGDFAWFPLWHCGMPIQNTYVPSFHWAVALFSRLSGYSAGRSYHFFSGLAYALGPVTLFWMLRRLGASKSIAFATALAYSLCSPVGVLLPEIRQDLGGLTNALRLRTSVVYGEVGHVAALTILPLVIVFLQGSLSKDPSKLRELGFASISIALIILTNTPGTAAMMLAVLAWVVVQAPGSRVQALKIATVAGILGYGIACYGVPLSALSVNLKNVGVMQPAFSAFRIPLLGALILATGAAGFALARLRVPLAARYGVTLSVLFGCIVVTADPRRFELFPQGGRFQLELEMAVLIALIGSIGMWWPKVPRLAQTSMLLIGALLTLTQIANYRMHARYELRPANAADRSEYQVAKWLSQNLTGQRVFALGSTSFWLDAFYDIPQFTGCCDQSITNPQVQAVRYLVPLGEPALAARWLRGYGVQAVLVPGPGSTEEYSDFPNLTKFDGVLPVLSRVHGITVYGVPQSNSSLAHTVRRDEVLLSTPRDFHDAVADRYLGAIEDPTRHPLEFTWLPGSKARIKGNLAQEDLVTVQVSFLPGWAATANGRPIAVQHDGLGLTVLAPKCEGSCEILLEWSGPKDIVWMTWTSGVSILIAAGLVLYGSIARPKAAALQPAAAHQNVGMPT